MGTKSARTGEPTADETEGKRTTMADGGIETAVRAAALKETDASRLDDINESGRSPGAVFAPSDLVPFITVVVPVRNEARFIARTIEQLVDQDYPGDRFEVSSCGRSIGRRDPRDRRVAGRRSSQHESPG